VSQIVLPYDYDQLIPAFAFGAIPNIDEDDLPVSHCFPLSGDPKNI